MPEAVAKPSLSAGKPNYKAPSFAHPTARQGNASSAIENAALQITEDADWLCVDDPNGWYNNPLSLNRWNYTNANPINFTDPSGNCKNPDGSIDFWRWPWGPWWDCPTNTGESVPTPSPTLVAILTATATCTPTPIGTPYPTLTVTPMPPTGGLTEDDIRILAVIIALESSSGVVPDDVNYLKAWSLLNLRSYHQAYNRNLRPFESWKHHERPLLDELSIGGTYDEQVVELLRWYQRYSNGEIPRVGTERFASIESAVKSAVVDWALYGSNSSFDPVHGSTGFTDASGLYYPSGSINDRHLFEIPNYISEIMTNEAEMERFRLQAYSNSSRLYQFTIDPYTGKPAYTFTWFEPPSYPWP